MQTLSALAESYGHIYYRRYDILTNLSITWYLILKGAGAIPKVYAFNLSGLNNTFIIE
jgi:hypothetical protein